MRSSHQLGVMARDRGGNVGGGDGDGNRVEAEVRQAVGAGTGSRCERVRAATGVGTVGTVTVTVIGLAVVERVGVGGERLESRARERVGVAMDATAGMAGGSCSEAGDDGGVKGDGRRKGRGVTDGPGEGRAEDGMSIGVGEDDGEATRTAGGNEVRGRGAMEGSRGGWGAERTAGGTNKIGTGRGGGTADTTDVDGNDDVGGGAAGVIVGRGG